MKPSTLQNLKYFEGKICTVFLPAVNRSFDEPTSRKHFVVRVYQVDADGIWGRNIINGMVSFFSLQHIISIQEEEEVRLDPDNPEHQKLIQECSPSEQSCEGCGTAAPQPDATFVDINSLVELAKNTKRSYDQL